MKISTKQIYKASYIYLILPLLIFLATWLNLAMAFVSSTILCYTYYLLQKNIDTDNNCNFYINKNSFKIIIIIAFLWCYLAGIGYFYYQSFDYHFRNALYRDLINYDWPVFLPKADTPLVYYIAFWLPSAFLTKITTFFIHSNHIKFIIGNIYLLIYATIGACLIFCNLTITFKAKSKKQILLIIGIFIFFSGLDIFGDIFIKTVDQPFKFHIEWWNTRIQYSSFTTSIFWIFNQFIPCGLITLLVYNERNIKNFGLALLLTLFSSPYSAIALGIYLIVYALNQLINATNKKHFISSYVFSKINLISIFYLLPIVILYYCTNSDGVNSKIYFILELIPLKVLVAFILLEFLIYILFIYNKYKKDLFFNVTIIILFLPPLISFNHTNNICMRAAIPALIILYIYVTKYILSSKNKLNIYIITILLLCGSITVFNEFYRGFYNIYTSKKIDIVADDVYTLNKQHVYFPLTGDDINFQFTAKNYKNDIFWKYFSGL